MLLLRVRRPQVRHIEESLWPINDKYTCTKAQIHTSTQYEWMQCIIVLISFWNFAFHSPLCIISMQCLRTFRKYTPTLEVWIFRILTVEPSVFFFLKWANYAYKIKRAVAVATVTAEDTARIIRIISVVYFFIMTIICVKFSIRVYIFVCNVQKHCCYSCCYCYLKWWVTNSNFELDSIIRRLNMH